MNQIKILRNDTQNDTQNDTRIDDTKSPHHNMRFC